ncbi:hypothetical protein H4R18_002709 [Coemansia javaensis]|uniref:Retrotransposon gag domain-containing protein n=1 Tax=Coemansia javaensis TaxID=2761396 RepID=A0A9W8LIR9_9FUNG|nr:hypothetical protein H4R18_002709 [Coemansia javaensis]
MEQLVYARPAPYTGAGCVRRWLREMALFVRSVDAGAADSPRTMAAAVLLNLGGTARVWGMQFVGDDGRLKPDPQEFLDLLGAEFDLLRDSARAEIELLELRQTGSVGDYIVAFRGLAARLAMSDAEMRARFAAGLKDHIRRACDAQSPATFKELRQLAVFEEGW